MRSIIPRLFMILAACAFLAGNSRGADADDLEGYLEGLIAADTLKDLEALHTKWDALLVDPEAEDLIETSLAKVKNEQTKTLLGISKETFRDARDKSPELAASTLAIRLVLLEMYKCNTAKDVAAVFRKHPDVVEMPRLKTAFSRIAKHPSLDENGIRLMEELYKSFLAAVDDPDAGSEILMRAVKANASGKWPDEGESEPAADEGTNGAAGAGKKKKSPSQKTADTPKPAQDSPLVGHWESNSQSAGILTSQHLILDASGEFAFWTVEDYPTGTTKRSGTDKGTWTASATSLKLNYNGGQVEEFEFSQADGDHLVMPKLGDRGKWTRRE